MKTITRTRKIKNRFGISNGPCFWAVHWFKWSLYVGKPVKRLSSRLKAIEDNKGIETITTGGAA
jgi:hypothetical protein